MADLAFSLHGPVNSSREPQRVGTKVKSPLRPPLEEPQLYAHEISRAPLKHVRRLASLYARPRLPEADVGGVGEGLNADEDADVVEDDGAASGTVAAGLLETGIGEEVLETGIGEEVNGRYGVALLEELAREAGTEGGRAELTFAGETAESDVELYTGGKEANWVEEAADVGAEYAGADGADAAALDLIGDASVLELRAFE